MIKSLEIVNYPRDRDGYLTKSFQIPDWNLVLAHLETMYPYEKPMLYLLQHTDARDRDLMCVTGGNDLFHVQIADSAGHWFSAYNPKGSDEVVDVWTSDQGFACEREWTWPLLDTSELLKHYFETAERHPNYQWE